MKRTIFLRLVPVIALIALAGCSGEESPTGPSTITTEDIVVGPGATAVNGDLVSVHYTGMFTNGTKFDSSYDLTPPQPYTFRLGTGAVIPGFEQGIIGMKVGGKRRVTVPPSLAYGSAGRGNIPPNATLVFDIDLMSIAGK